MARGMKSLHDVCSSYDHVFFRVTFVIACVVVDNPHCTIFGWIKLAMTMFTKVQKQSLVIRISIQCQVW